MEHDYNATNYKHEPASILSSERIVPSRHNTLPLSIYALGIFQILRGLFIVILLSIAFLAPSSDYISNINTKIVTYVLARQNISSDGAMIALAFAAIYFVISGIELLRLKIWAKNLMMISSGSTVILWIRRFWFDNAFGTQTLHTALQKQSVYIVIGIDIIVFMCLGANSDLFRKKK
jgi:hypothetical protein